MILGISDLHLDYTKEKDMCIFGEHWINYEEKIMDSWHRRVTDQDLVLVPGDISWAMTLAEAEKDLRRIDRLPGKKILIKGNHDYWWSSIGQLRSLKLDTMHFLQNDSLVINGIRFVGTRGWAFPEGEESPDDLKIFNRERIRLSLSFDYPTGFYEKTVCLLHYPPFQKDGRLNDIGKLVLDRQTNLCVYGHLHGGGLAQVVERMEGGTQFFCLSADYINFQPRNLYV